MTAWCPAERHREHCRCRKSPATAVAGLGAAWANPDYVTHGSRQTDFRGTPEPESRATPADYCCDGDINMDGNVDQDDVTTLVGLIAGDPVPCGVEPDFNHDGNVDQDDLADFINFIGGSPCPW